MSTETPDRAVEPPVFAFRDQFLAESYWPEEYITAALPALEALGWLVRPVVSGDQWTALRVLYGLRDTGLDETDVYPFGFLWSLRSTGAVADVPGLDSQLVDWRQWEESNHLGEPLDFLPPLAPSTELHARNVAEVNARLAAEGRCVMHNSATTVQARYLLEVPIGNVLPLCSACRQWWQADAKTTGDPMSQPVRITEIVQPGTDSTEEGG